MTDYDSLTLQAKKIVSSASNINDSDIDLQAVLYNDTYAKLNECKSLLLEVSSDIFKSIGLKTDNINDKLFMEATDKLLNTADAVIHNRKRDPADAERLKLSNSRRKKAFSFNRSNDNMPKPQNRFDTAPDNFEGVFIPRLFAKPNALIPLSESLKPAADSSNIDGYMHPYETEIKSFKYSDSLFQRRVPLKPPNIATSPWKLITDTASFERMLDDLSGCTEIAVDLEHHDFRSYRGFVCLMQISTRSMDYIIDTLLLRSELHKLNTVFTNPEIVKVLHGATMDVNWLQRDFGVYLVQMFDTYPASNVLSFSGHGLAFLLKKYANVEAQKEFQLADWRIRPLPEAMINYARSDTHYLLYIYDHMVNELLNHSSHAMKNVLDSCRQLCLTKYEHPDVLFSSPCWLNLHRKNQSLFNRPEIQLPCMKALFVWRDKIARQEDESFQYVLSNRNLVKIAVSMPDTSKDLLRLISSSSPHVRQKVDEIIEIITRAKKGTLIIVEGGSRDTILDYHKNATNLIEKKSLLFKEL